MNCRIGDRTPATRAAEKKTVDALVTELVANGTDLRSVSLEEMKRRLTTALRSRRCHTTPETRLTSAV